MNGLPFWSIVSSFYNEHTHRDAEFRWPYLDLSNWDLLIHEYPGSSLHDVNNKVRKFLLNNSFSIWKHDLISWLAAKLVTRVSQFSEKRKQRSGRDLLFNHISCKGRCKYSACVHKTLISWLIKRRFDCWNQATVIYCQLTNQDNKAWGGTRRWNGWQVSVWSQNKDLYVYPHPNIILPILELWRVPTYTLMKGQYFLHMNLQ